MYSPVDVAEIQAGRTLSLRGNRHALLDRELAAMKTMQQKEAQMEVLAAPLPYFQPPVMEKMHFADFLEHGWSGAEDLAVPENDAAESLKYLENLKSQFSDFTFLMNCGRGSFGHVWLVEDMTGLIVALKTIPRKRNELFRQELSSLKLYRRNIRNFTNLVQIHHVGLTRDFFFYTMDAAYSVFQKSYVPLTLRNLFRFCTFAPRESFDIVKSLLCGVAELHSHALSHRDIKPENIIFAGLTPKLCDMGLVSPSREKDSGGSRGFIPPDFAVLPDENAGTSCDLYAMGKVLYGILANDEFLWNYPRLPREILKNSFVKELNKVINTACASSYRDRFQTAENFTEALENAASPRRGWFLRRLIR